MNSSEAQSFNALNLAPLNMAADAPEVEQQKEERLRNKKELKRGREFLISSESMNEGHPDEPCDKDSEIAVEDQPFEEQPFEDQELEKASLAIKYSRYMVPYGGVKAWTDGK